MITSTHPHSIKKMSSYRRNKSIILILPRQIFIESSYSLSGEEINFENVYINMYVLYEYVYASYK